MNFLHKIRSLIKKAVITGPADNNQQYPVQQVSFKRKTANCEMIFPYGVYSNPASNSSGVVMFSIDGNDSNRAGIPYTPDRPIDLEQDEVSFYHPKTKTFVKMRNNGDIEIDTDVESKGGNIIVNTVDANIVASGNVSAEIGGDATVEVAGNSNLTVDGNVEVEVGGNMNADITGNLITNSNNLDMTYSTGTLNASNTTISGITSLNGGPAIARVGDQIQVVIPSGSSAGTWPGTIITGGANTSS